MFKQILKFIITIVLIFGLLISGTYIKKLNSKLTIVFDSITKLETIVNTSITTIYNLSNDIFVEVNKVKVNYNNIKDNIISLDIVIKDITTKLTTLKESIPSISIPAKSNTTTTKKKK